MKRFDPRGVLAVMSVIFAFAIQALLIYQGNTTDMPPWVVGLVSAIVAFYFGYKSGNGVTTDVRRPDDPRRPYDPQEPNRSEHGWDPPVKPNE